MGGHPGTFSWDRSTCRVWHIVLILFDLRTESASRQERGEVEAAAFQKSRAHSCQPWAHGQSAGASAMAQLRAAAPSPFLQRSPVAGARSSLGPGIVLLVILVTRLLAIESRMVAFSGTGLAGHVLLRCVKMARITPARLWPHSGSPEVGGEPPAAHQTGQRQAEQSGWAKRSPDPQQLGSQPRRFSRLRDASLLRWEKTFTRPHFPQPHALC